MARPMTATQFVSLLDQWDIPHKSNERGGVKWYNHNRNTKGKFDAVFGIGNHHTGGNSDKAGADVLWNGYGSLPGPLCHAGIMADGTVLLNGWGRVNHFGLGDDDVMQHVIHEDYTGILKPNEANVDGNRHFYGFEWMYDGLSEPAEKFPKLYRTAVRVNAAICTFHKWTEKSSITHGEWQPGKWDPGHAKGKLFDAAKFRNHIEQAIKEGPKPLPTRPKPPTPNPTGTVTVSKGDTLISLAKDHLGSSARWTDIVAANPTLVRALNVGEKLTLPKK